MSARILPTKLFPAGNPIGGEIDIRGLPYRVIGVEEVKGTVFGIPQDSFIVIPLKTYQVNFGPLIRQRSLYFTATSRTDDVFADAVEEARFLMRARRKLGPGEKDNFGIVTPDAITGLRDRLFGTIFLVAIAVPAIAMIVGAIVIMNIMLVQCNGADQRDRAAQIAGGPQGRHTETVSVRSCNVGHDRRRGWHISGVGCGQDCHGDFLSDVSFARGDLGLPWRYREAWAFSPESSRHGKPRVWIRSKHCALTANRGAKTC